MQNQQEAKQHAAEMREMGDVAIAEETAEHLDDRIPDDEPLGLDGKQEIEIDHRVGEQHSESQQKAIDGSRRAHGVHHIQIVAHCHDMTSAHVNTLVLRQQGRVLDVLHRFLAQARAKAANQIEHKKALGSPNVLYCVAKHPQGEHVEEQMLEVGVHEHVGEQLVEPEVAGLEEMKAKDFRQVDVEPVQGESGQKHQDIDNQQVLHHGRQHPETGWTVLFVHFLGFKDLRFKDLIFKDSRFKNSSFQTLDCFAALCSQRLAVTQSESTTNY